MDGRRCGARADLAVLEWLGARRWPALDALPAAGAVLGSSAALWAVLAVGTVLLGRGRHGWSGALLWISLPGSRVLSGALKAAYDRPRSGPTWRSTCWGGASSTPAVPRFLPGTR